MLEDYYVKPSTMAIDLNASAAMGGSVGDWHVDQYNWQASPWAHQTPERNQWVTHKSLSSNAHNIIPLSPLGYTH
jgi:hypothetical protein